MNMMMKKVFSAIMALIISSAITFVQAQEDSSLLTRRQECTAEDMSKRSEPNEHCYNCRLCLQRQCVDTGNWKSYASRSAYWCKLLLEGERNGRPHEWLGCLENNGTSRTLTVSDPSVIHENGGNRDTWGTCARRCDNFCVRQRVTRTNTEDGLICTSGELATQSSSHDDICFPCRQCLRRHCDASWSKTECNSIVNGLTAGTAQDWIQCLHHDGENGRRLNQQALRTGGRALQETDTSLWSDCARKCNVRCHHAISDFSQLEPESPFGAYWVEPFCRLGEGNESQGTPRSALVPHSDTAFFEHLKFRIRGEMTNGRTSYEQKISVSGGGWNNVLVELTNRPILDGETFEIRGNKYQVGVGLCIESCDMANNNKYGIRWNYNCIGFYGDNGGSMFTTKPDGTEYIVRGVNGHISSSRQGFTYDADNNCVTPYVGGGSRGTCQPLPNHFEGKVVRAIGQVWNSASADLVLHPPPAIH